MNATAEQPHSARSAPLLLEPTRCCLCDVEDVEPIGSGEDFEYHTSPDTFRAVRCRQCGLLFLDPRPAQAELSRIYPDSYHAFDFSADRFGLVYQVRRRLEAHRLLSWCRDLPEDAHILDVGCGDGFHLELLQAFGRPDWRLFGAEPDPRAAEMARQRGLEVFAGRIEDAPFPEASFDLAILIQTVEHVDDPPAVLRRIRNLLAPGGRLVIVTDNADTLDAHLFGGRHWGGYHFPRHWNLFDRRTLRTLAEKVGLQVVDLSTQVSPVNWVYSIRNALVDWHAPQVLVDRFSLDAPGALAAFTVLDGINQLAGRGALLRAILERPREPVEDEEDAHATRSDRGRGIGWPDGRPGPAPARRPGSSVRGGHPRRGART